MVAMVTVWDLGKIALEKYNIYIQNTDLGSHTRMYFNYSYEYDYFSTRACDPNVVGILVAQNESECFKKCTVRMTQYKNTVI